MDEKKKTSNRKLLGTLCGNPRHERQIRKNTTGDAEENKCNGKRN